VLAVLRFGGGAGAKFTCITSPTHNTGQYWPSMGERSMIFLHFDFARGCQLGIGLLDMSKDSELTAYNKVNEQGNHGIVNYTDTKAECRHLNKIDL
jgi:hypothetical protein